MRQPHGIQVGVRAGLDLIGSGGLAQGRCRQRGIQGRHHRRRKGRVIVHRDQGAVTPAVQDLARPARAIGGDHRGPHRQGLDQHEAKPLPAGGEGEEVRVGHVGIGMRGQTPAGRSRPPRPVPRPGRAGPREPRPAPGSSAGRGAGPAPGRRPAAGCRNPCARRAPRRSGSGAPPGRRTRGGPGAAGRR